MILDNGCGMNNNCSGHPHGDLDCDIDLPKEHINNLFVATLMRALERMNFLIGYLNWSK